MHSLYRNNFRRYGLLSFLLAISLLSSPVLAWQNGAATTKQSASGSTVVTKKTTTDTKKASSTLTPDERKVSARVKLETIRDLTTALSSKEFEGRGTAQPGADKAARYIADYFAKLGLKPAGDNGTYLQAIKFRSAQLQSESSVKIGDAELKHGDDYVLLPPYNSAQVNASGGVVFAGYGVVSQELKRDDLAGLDLKGKVVILMGGQPQGVDTAAWQRATAPQLRAMGIFGRGAEAMIVANAGTAAQPFSTISNYLSRRRVSLASSPAAQFMMPPVLLVSDAAMEKIFVGSGSTYAEIFEKAKRGETVSRDFGTNASVAIKIKIEEAPSSNVVGVLEGSDPKLKEEAVVYSAHYDAYGIDSSGRIFAGAADNALGTATIMSIAEGFAKSFPKPASRPRRSIIFLAVTGEEYGLFGAEHWVANPTWPLAKVAANINYDGIGTEVYGPVKRVVGFGAEHSDLGTVFEDVLAATGTVVTPDPMPEENAFVRSDHYAFVKRGVPALMLMGGPEGDLASWLPRMKQWLATDYHSTSDVVKPDWNWSGPQTLGQIGMIIGLRVANADAMPAWRSTSPYNRPRNAARQSGH
ncbi:MAG TPA: M28 family peptidase [Pyrinomonadaceae bacterium]|nr:M28 family peptidase [Pyrinomonadaceae bacterium]